MSPLEEVLERLRELELKCRDLLTRVKLLEYEKDSLKSINTKFLDILLETEPILNTYINGGNPNSPYNDGKHFCYVMGAKNCLDKIHAIIKYLDEKESK